MYTFYTLQLALLSQWALCFKRMLLHITVVKIDFVLLWYWSEKKSCKFLWSVMSTKNIYKKKPFSFLIYILEFYNLCRWLNLIPLLNDHQFYGIISHINIFCILAINWVCFISMIFARRLPQSILINVRLKWLTSTY